MYPVGRSAFTAFSRSVDHYLRMAVSPTDVTLEAVGTDGATFDRFTLNLAQQQGDTAAPQVSIVSPSAGAVVSGTEAIQVTADDDARVEKVDLWIDGVQQAIDLTEPYTFTIDSTALSNGTHVLEARAHDLDGRRATASRTVTVSTARRGTMSCSTRPRRRSGPEAGAWSPTSSAAGGRRPRTSTGGAATIDPPLANPVDFVEFSVNVMPDTNYRLWLRLKGAGNSGYSDSGVGADLRRRDADGSPVYRLGTTSATRVNLQDCAGCTISGWGWQDNGYGTGVLGPALRFATGGVQTIRIQAREDGVSIDQVVLSPATYLTRAPGALKNDTTILAESRLHAKALAASAIRERHREDARLSVLSVNVRGSEPHSVETRCRRQEHINARLAQRPGHARRVGRRQVNSDNLPRGNRVRDEAAARRVEQVPERQQRDVHLGQAPQEHEVCPRPGRRRPVSTGAASPMRKPTCCSGSRRVGLWRTRSTRTVTEPTVIASACPGAGNISRTRWTGRSGATARTRATTSGEEMSTARAFRVRCAATASGLK